MVGGEVCSASPSTIQLSAFGTPFLYRPGHQSSVQTLWSCSYNYRMAFYSELVSTACPAMLSCAFRQSAATSKTQPHLCHSFWRHSNI